LEAIHKEDHYDADRRQFSMLVIAAEVLRAGFCDWLNFKNPDGQLERKEMNRSKR
jgi:hypothetical protein